VLLGDATFHDPSSSLDVTSLLAFRLHEDGQQDDATAGCDPIRDPRRPASEIEAQLSQPAIELLSVRFVEQWSFLCQPVDVEIDAALLVGYLLFEVTGQKGDAQPIGGMTVIDLDRYAMARQIIDAAP